MLNFATGQMTPPPRAEAVEYFPMTPEVGGRLAARGRPTPLVEVRPQERVQRHTVEHTVDVLPMCRFSMCLCRRWGTSWWNSCRCSTLQGLKIRSGPNPAALCGPASSAAGRTVGGSADCRVLFLSARQARRVWTAGAGTAAHLDDAVPVVPLLHTFVPQMVDQLVEVLRLIDTVVLEQLIDVPKITSQDVIPQRAVLRVPQMAEQLVDEPVLPSTTSSLFKWARRRSIRKWSRGSRVRDAYGRAWCRVVGPVGSTGG